MAQKFVNGGRFALMNGIVAGATSFNVLGGGALPAATVGAGALESGDWYRLVLQDSAGFEVVLVCSHAAGATLQGNVLRGQEGTVARAWSAGAVVGNRWTAADAEAATESMGEALAGKADTASVNAALAMKADAAAVGAALAGKANAADLEAKADAAAVNAALAQKADTTAMNTALIGKQDALVSGANIKTINGHPVPGTGDIVLPTLAQFNALADEVVTLRLLVEGGSATAPSAFVAGGWSLTSGSGQLTLDVAALPVSGGSPITSLEYRIGSGAALALGGTGVGPRTIAGLTNGTEYSIQIRAVNAVGAGAWSDTKSATPTAAATAPSAFVAGDWTLAAGDGQAALTITTLPNNGGSAITALQYRLNAGSAVALSGTGAGSRTISSLTNGTAYSVQVRAVNAVGPGTWSDTKSVTPAAQPGGTPATALLFDAAPILFDSTPLVF